MKKKLPYVAPVLICLGTLSGCATTSALTPCEKAILAKAAAEKVLSYVCPLSAPVESEGVY